jgi:thioredoxin 1
MPPIRGIGARYDESMKSHLLAASALLAGLAVPSHAIIDRDLSMLDRYMDEANKVLAQGIPEALETAPVVQVVTQADFDSKVLKSKRPVLVLFCADRLKPCQDVGEVIAQIAKQSIGKADVVKVDVDRDQALLAALLPKGTKTLYVPALYLFQGGKAIKVKLVAIVDDKGDVTGVKIVPDVP